MPPSQQKLSTFAWIKMTEILRVIYGVFRMTFCIVHNLYCIPGYLFLNLLMLPLYYISMETYSKIENQLYYSLLYIVSWWGYGGGMIVYEHGDDIYKLREDDPNIRLLLVANHQSTADVPLMFQAFSSRPQFSLLWIMDRAFKWTNFGVVSQIHGDYFLSPKNYVADSILNHCRKRYSSLKDMIIIFPEGGFRYKRLQSSIAFANKRNYPIMYNVTYPRVNGFRELLHKDLNITHVVDLTICYDDPEKVPSILDIVRGKNFSGVHFYYKIHSIQDPEQNFESEEWLYEQWQKKEALLANHYAAIKRNIRNINKDQDGDSLPSIDSSKLENQVPKQEQSSLKSSLLRKRNENHYHQTVAPNLNSPLYSKINDKSNNSNNYEKEENSDSYHMHNNNNHPYDQYRINDNSSPLSSPLSSPIKFRSLQELNSLHFDLNEGRPVHLNFLRVMLYHLGYLLVCTLIYYAFIMLIVPMF